MIDFRVLDDLEAVSREAVALCVEEFTRTSGPFSIALSGGKTPGRAYELLAEAPLDWNRVHVYWVDERCVPPGHPDSNQGLARRALIDRVPIPGGNVHPMDGEADPFLAAEAYAHLLNGVTINVCFMGMGSDGHTASLFPGDDASLVSDDRVRHTRSPAGIPDRLTLTPHVLAEAGLKLFLICGEDKRIPLQKFLAGEPLPSRVVADQGRSIVLADRAAAGEA